MTWEHVVPDRPASSAPSAATLVPLPPPRRVPPPPPQPVSTFQPPAPSPLPKPTSSRTSRRRRGRRRRRSRSIDDEVQVEEVVIEGRSRRSRRGRRCIAARIRRRRGRRTGRSKPSSSGAGRRQPEVNRLASVPDAFDDDDDAPIELPPITPSGPIVTHNPVPYTPVLAETLFVPSPARPATSMVAAIVAEEQGKTNKKKKGKRGKVQASRKPKRHLFRTFMTLVLLFGLLAGGAFAAKKYLLNEPTWSVELKPLADQVAAARGLQFSEAVTVSPVPVTDYASRLAGSAIETSGSTRADVAGTRAAERRPRPRSCRQPGDERFACVLRSGDQDHLRQRRSAHRSRISTASRCTGR